MKTYQQNDPRTYLSQLFSVPTDNLNCRGRNQTVHPNSVQYSKQFPPADLFLEQFVVIAFE